ncbi:MAG: HNH endonuclease [Myxococcaceae bacterium]
MTTLAAAARWNETLVSLWADERKAAAEFLLALAEFDEKNVWVALGYNSLFRYLTGSLRMSEATAFRRLQAVRLSRWCPEIVPAIEDGKLCFSTLTEVSKVVTPDNWKEVLPRFFGASKRQAETLVAEMLPGAATPKGDVIVPMRSLSPVKVKKDESAKVQSGESARWGMFGGSSQGEVAASTREDGACPPGETGGWAEAADGTRTPPPRVATPMHRIHFTASEKFVQKRQKAKDALAHRVDTSQLEAVLDAALEALLEKEAKRPRAGVSQAAKREVQQRDEGQCQWPLLQGAVCGEKRFLQIDHVIPKARGGDGATDNLRLLCARHNREAAKQAFGEVWVGRLGSE